MEPLKHFLSSALTDCGTSNVEQLLSDVMAALEKTGCDTLEDIKYVRETDLSPPLKPIQARKLLQRWESFSSGMTVYCATVKQLIILDGF